jgi:hypothetical protein
MDAGNLFSTKNDIQRQAAGLQEENGTAFTSKMVDGARRRISCSLFWDTLLTSFSST